MRFRPGDPIVRRDFQHRRNSGAWVGRVVSDDSEHGLWIWVASGSAHRSLGHADGRHVRQVPFAEWDGAPKAYDESPWRGNVLMFHPTEGDYSVWRFLTPDGELVRYYVNLERPVVRWRDESGLCGIDTVDYDLDVVITPSLEWSWKDEDEFAERLAYPGVYWVEDERAVRAEGERVIKLAVSGSYPFDDAMAGFRADPAWPVPTDMPDGWDRPRAW